MSAKDTGGAAFPQNVHRSDKDYQWVESVDGMTLRDYFAAKAMQGFAADPSSHALFDDFDDMAINAYRAADAMLAARKEAT